jgi:propanol-preferring alcohol dehydrogenase
MRALRYLPTGEVKLVETDIPAPQAGQVQLAVKAAGICHSDVRIAEGTSVARVAEFAPFTLGHEVAGVVVGLGPDVNPSLLGQEVAVYGPTGCLDCPSCTAGAWNYCDRRNESSVAGIGLGTDGGLAPYMVVDARRVVPASGVDPGVTAVLTDAALTSYHAISLIGWRPAPPHVVVVIGIGGLGHLAVQILAHRGSAVVAVDRRPEIEDLAMSSGADVFCTPDQVADVVRDRSGGRGATAVLDFVGATPTIALGESLLGSLGDFMLVGSAGGVLPIDKNRSGPRRGLGYRLPVWGTLSELEAVVELGRDGHLRPELVRIELAEAERRLRDLASGSITGRLVVTGF